MSLRCIEYHTLYSGIRNHRSGRRQGDPSRLFQRRFHQASSGRCTRCHQYHPATGHRCSDEKLLRLPRKLACSCSALRSSAGYRKTRPRVSSPPRRLRRKSRKRWVCRTPLSTMARSRIWPGYRASLGNLLPLAFGTSTLSPVTEACVNRFVQLDVFSGKVSVGGDGNKQLSFTSRPDVARYIIYVLTHLPAEQLKNRDRRFAVAGDNKVLSGFYMAR